MRFFLYTSLLVLLSACNTKAPAILSDTVKTQEQDPFKSTMAASQFFDIDTHDDQVIEGENGTVVVFPKESIIDKNGNPFYGKVRVELTEALQLKDMLLSNLTTLSDGKLLETGGMIYLNLTIEGQQAGIHPDHPVFIEIPTANKKSGMMAYRGIRDENGNMNWVDPQPLETSLTAVDIFSLDFLPNGFQAEVERSLPFGPYTTATKALVDSLYFSLNTGVLQMEFQATELNEPFYNADKQVINGKYTDESYNTKNTHAAEGSNDRPEVSPAMIQVIQSEAYQNTLIATREFEQRLQTIFKTCSNAVLEIYVKNLDQNLWELDQKAAQYVEKSGDTATANLFYQYAEQRLTKVDHPKPHTPALNRYFTQQLKAVQKELASTRKELTTALHKKDKAVQKTVSEYKQLLWKREKYRMEKYGYEWAQTGWMNIDRGIIPKTNDFRPLQVLVENGGDFDRVYCYTVYTSLRSLYRLNSLDKTTFYVGNDQEKSMLMPEKKSAVVIAIGYKGTARALAWRLFETGTDTVFSLHLAAITPEAMDQVLHLYDEYLPENRISDDLVFMDQLYQEQQRQASLQRDYEMMWRLYSLAFPCRETKGLLLFREYCAFCHHTNMTDKLTGPALAGVRGRWSDDKALYGFIRNSQKMISSGHPRAVAQWNTWKPVLMNDFEQLTDEEIKSILAAIAHRTPSAY